MAFVLLNHVNRRERQFKARVALNNITDYDLRHYRFPRDILEDLINQFSESDFCNTTERSHAISAETQVSSLEVYVQPI